MKSICSTCHGERKVFYPTAINAVGWEHWPDCVTICPECEGDGRNINHGAVDVCDVCCGKGIAQEKINGNPITTETR